MYDTARRIALVKQRVRENTRRRQRRGIYGLSAACMLLFAVLMQAADALIAPGQAAAWGSFGTMLLREDAGGYVLVAVVSFAAAVVITALCFRLRIREKQKKVRRTSTPDTKRRRKANEKTNTQHPAPMLHVADAADDAADNGLCCG
ncbi:MAG: glycosyltransferase [[Ruminococcus] lactaris]